MAIFCAQHEELASFGELHSVSWAWFAGTFVAGSTIPPYSFPSSGLIYIILDTIQMLASRLCLSRSSSSVHGLDAFVEAHRASVVYYLSIRPAKSMKGSGMRPRSSLLQKIVVRAIQANALAALCQIGMIA